MDSKFKGEINDLYDIIQRNAELREQREQKDKRKNSKGDKKNKLMGKIKEQLVTMVDRE